MTGIDESVQPDNNHAMEDTIHLNVYQTINANNNTISAESKAFAETTTAKVVALFAKVEEVAVAA